VYFVYRSPYEGPLSQRVRRLTDETPLAWFRRGWGVGDPRSWVEAELGGRVYGLSSIFAAALEKNLPRPETTAELRVLLHRNLYVEGGEDYVRLDDHSLRVRTDDDEVELAYFFVDDDIVASAVDRLAYLLQTSWPLPYGVGTSKPFVPDVPVTVATPAGTDETTTYAVFLTHYDGTTLARLRPLAFPGVGLATLARHLRDVAHPSDLAWPAELIVLRALLAPDDVTILPALERCNRWPGFNLNANPWPDLPDGHDAAHRQAQETLRTGESLDGRRPELSLIRVDGNLAQLALHCSQAFGYQQWYLFDSTWAARHPSVAQSLLRYAGHWDPLGD
jgi:hypothetical protein